MARGDLMEILDYLDKEWNRRIVLRFIDLVDETVSRIGKNPRQFPMIHRKEKIRKCVLTKHNSLYYRIHKDKVEILRIFDTRQDPAKLTFPKKKPDNLSP